MRKSILFLSVASIPAFCALTASARQPGFLNQMLGTLQSGVAQQQAAQAAQQQGFEAARQQAAANANAAWSSIDPQVYRCLSTTMSPPPVALAGSGIPPGDYRVQPFIQRCIEGIAQAQAQNAAVQRASAEEAGRQQLAQVEAAARARQQQPDNPPVAASDAAASNPADAFLNPALFTQTEVQLVQDALIWTGNYVGLKDGVWGKGTVDSVRSWRHANNLQPAVSLRPAEMVSLLTQAATAKNALNWALVHDQTTGVTVGMPRGLIAPRSTDGVTYYTGNGGISLELKQYPGQIDAVRASVTAAGLGSDARKVNYRLDKPDRQVISFDAASDSTVYIRVDRTGTEWKGFRLKISHDTAGLGALITAFSADFDASGNYPGQADQGSMPQLFSLLTEARRNAPKPPIAMAVAQPLAAAAPSPGPIQQASSESKPDEAPKVIQPQPPAPPSRQPTAAMQATIHAGDPADLLVLANTAPDAPNAAVGLSGELTFLSGHGLFCNGPETGSNFDDNQATADWFAGHKLPSFYATTTCRSSTLDGLDGVLVARRSIQDLEPRLYNDIAQRLQVGTSEAFVILPETERKKAHDQREQARSETQASINSGRLGFGYAAIANTSGTACVVSDASKGQIWSVLLNQQQKEISLDLGRSIQPQAMISDADTAYIAGRRGNCGIVIAAAEQLKSMFKAFERDHVAGSYGSVWFSPESLEKVAATLGTGSASAEQLAEKARQQSQQEQELRARREEAEGVTRAQKTKQLRATYEASATAMRNDVGPKALSLFKETIPGQQSLWAADAFPSVTAEAAKRRAEGWEFADGSYEVIDYGRSNWSDRNLETGVIKIQIKLKNADIGRYDDLCLNLAYQYDAEFKRIRSPEPIECDAPIELSRWMRSLSFDSQWNAP